MLVTRAHADAQQDGRVGIGRTLELFGDVGLVGGHTRIESRSPVQPTEENRTHFGIRGEGGIQTRYFAAGMGLREWRLNGSGINNSGWDGFLVTELRPRPEGRTTFRASAGVSVESLGSPWENLAGSENARGTLWSVGLGHEVTIHAMGFLHFTADVLVPASHSDRPTRRAPVLELGVGYRLHRLVPIRPVRE